MPIIAMRGNVIITDELELKAYLAAMLRLENAGLLLGAGASVPCGGMTMASVWNRFVDEFDVHANWLKAFGFVDNDATSTDNRKMPNMERLLDSLEIAVIEWGRQCVINGPNPVDADEIVAAENLADLKNARKSLYRLVVEAALLENSWWESPAGVESDDAALLNHRTILQKLVSARQPAQPSPWVFTTNYDLAIEWAAESIDLQVINGFLGTHSRRFSPHSFDMGFRNVQARGEARFGVFNIYLAKLHGSMTWRTQSGEIFEIPAVLARDAIQAFLEDDDIQDLGLMVMPRAAKYFDTVGYVLGEMFRRFAEFMAKPQAALIVCGYSFGDEHINRLIRSALLNPTLQVMIYFPGFDGNATSQALPKALRKILSLSNPRVTVVGGGNGAYVDALANQLPDPAIYDENLQRLTKALKDQMREVAP